MLSKRIPFYMPSDGSPLRHTQGIEKCVFSPLLTCHTREVTASLSLRLLRTIVSFMGKTDGLF